MAQEKSKYLSATELCFQSELSPEDLTKLEDAHLLLPNRDDLYRPKLVSWGRKLAYLLIEGWEIAEIKSWAVGRWKTTNPRLWPPDRNRWISKSIETVTPEE